ncbi:MAG: hypothetical protein AB8U66_01880 [Rickettsiales endosymbiont of Dermacentor nuttalli]
MAKTFISIYRVRNYGCHGTIPVLHSVEMSLMGSLGGTGALLASSTIYG